MLINTRFSCVIIAVALSLTLPAGLALATGQASALQEQAASQQALSPSTQTDTADASRRELTAIADVKLNKALLTIRNDGKKRLKATLVGREPGKEIANTRIKWSISDKRIARVSQNGIVQGKKAGIAKVTARASNGKKATAKVKVVIDEKKMATQIPVLTYHRIASDTAKKKVYRHDILAVSAKMFERQMKWLKKNGYRTISTTELKSWRVNGTFLPKKSILITIDDGFYETYHIAYPILRKYGFKATSFVIGTHVRDETRPYDAKSTTNHYLGWDVIKEVRRVYPDLEFQSHTFNMHQRAADGNGVACSWSRKKIISDFAENAKFGFSAIAYPFGHVSKKMLAVANKDKRIEIGFGYIMPWPATRTSPLYNMPRFRVAGNGSLRDFAHIAKTAG